MAPGRYPSFRHLSNGGARNLEQFAGLRDRDESQQMNRD
jgi:hypothetical protein